MSVWKRIAAVVTGVIVSAGTAGCAEEFHGKPPLQQDVRFPIGLAVDVDRSTLLVANSNFDLAYEGSSIVAIDVETNRFRDAFVAMGSFPGELTLTSSPEGDSAWIYAAVRGDNSLTWFSTGTKGGKFSMLCNDEGDAELPECSGAHVVTEGAVPEETDGVWTDQDVELGTDPISVALLPGEPGSPDRILVASLRSGLISLLDLGADGAPKVVAQYQASMGVNGLAVDPVTGRIFVTSKYTPVVYRLAVVEAEKGPELHLERVIPLPSIYQSGDYGRGIATAQNGRYLLISYRAPAAILVLNGGDEELTIEQEMVKVIPVGRSPGYIRVFDSGQGGAETAYVMCFGDDKVWAIDTESLLPVDSINVGAGPYEMAALLTADMQRGYVSNFLGHTISVVDLDPASPYYHSQIAEIH